MRTLKVKDSSTKKTQVGKQSEPKGLMTVADVAHRARMEASPLRKRFKDGAKTKLTEMKSSPLRAPSLMGNLKMPGTIFDGDDFMHENEISGRRSNDDLQLEHPKGSTFSTRAQELEVRRLDSPVMTRDRRSRRTSRTRSIGDSERSKRSSCAAISTSNRPCPSGWQGEQVDSES